MLENHIERLQKRKHPNENVPLFNVFEVKNLKINLNDFSGSDKV